MITLRLASTHGLFYFVLFWIVVMNEQNVWLSVLFLSRQVFKSLQLIGTAQIIYDNHVFLRSPDISCDPNSRLWVCVFLGYLTLNRAPS